MANSDLVKLTISELAPKIKAREVSPVEVTEAVLEQVDRLQPTLNSFITVLYDEARSQAKDQEAALMRGEYRGPLHGVPIGIRIILRLAASERPSAPRCWPITFLKRTHTLSAGAERPGQSSSARRISRSSRQDRPPTISTTVRCTILGILTISRVGLVEEVERMWRPV